MRTISRRSRTPRWRAATPAMAADKAAFAALASDAKAMQRSAPIRGASRRSPPMPAHSAKLGASAAANRSLGVDAIDADGSEPVGVRGAVGATMPRFSGAMSAGQIRSRARMSAPVRLNAGAMSSAWPERANVRELAVATGRAGGDGRQPAGVRRARPAHQAAFAAMAANAAQFAKYANNFAAFKAAALGGSDRGDGCQQGAFAALASDAKAMQRSAATRRPSLRSAANAGAFRGAERRTMPRCRTVALAASLMAKNQAVFRELRAATARRSPSGHGGAAVQLRCCGGFARDAGQAERADDIGDAVEPGGVRGDEREPVGFRRAREQSRPRCSASREMLRPSPLCRSNANFKRAGVKPGIFSGTAERKFAKAIGGD